MQRNTKPTLDFSPYIAEHTRDFTGRMWVFKAINNWLAKPDGARFFLLSGEPGSGKTAIASRLCQIAKGEVPFDSESFLTSGFLNAFHFCSARDHYWINPRNFILSLAGQLASCYPAYAKALPEAVVGRQIHLEVEQNIRQVTNGRIAGFVINKLEVNSDILPEDLFDQFVREPLETLFRGEVDQQIVILVDALDEALLYSGKVNIISLLAQATNLPIDVRFILTSRQDERVENQFLEADGLSLSTTQSDQDNQEDIRDYVKKRLRGNQELIQKIALVKSTNLTELEEKVIHKAAGNFQYVSFLLDAIAKNQQSLTDLEGLPAGLDGLYFLSLERVIKLGKYDWKDYAPLMGVLSVAQESLTLVQLQAFIKKEVDTAWAYLGDLLQFIEEVKAKGEEKSYRLYHQSVIDFLHRQSLVGEKKEQRNSFYLSADQWHAQIVDYYHTEGSTWLNINWKRVDNYGMFYLAAHLYMLRTREVYRKDLYKLICKPFMEEKQTRYGSHKPFAEDIILTIEVAEYEEPPNLVQVVRGSLLYTTLGSLATNIAPEALAVLAQMDETTEALGIAALMQDPKKQSYAYRLIGNALLSQRKLDDACVVLSKALMATQGIKDAQEKVTALGDIAQKLAQAEQFDQALEVATVIEIEQEKATALSEIIKMSIQTRNEEQILNIAKRSLEISIEDYKAKSIILHAIVQNLIQIGKHNQALILAQSIGDKKVKVTALMEVLYALTEKEEKEQAVNIALQMMQELEALATLEMARGIEYTGTELSIFIKIVQVLAQARLFDLALLMAEKVWGEENKANILGIVRKGLEALIEIGETEKAANLVHLALIVVEAMRSGQKNIDVLLGVARSLIQTEHFTSALEVTKAIWNEQGRVAGLSEVVEALSKAGEEEKAISVANQTLAAVEVMRDEKTRISALRKIVHTLIQANLFDQVLKFAYEVREASEKAVILSEIVLALALSGEKEYVVIVAKQALVAIKASRNRLTERSPLKMIVQGLAEIGHIHQMLIVAEALGDRWTKAAVLKEVALSLTQTMQFSKALDVVKVIWNEREKVFVLRDITQALVQMGERKQAVTIANLTLATAKAVWVERDRTSMLQELAKDFAQLGQINQAISAALAIGDDWVKANALREIAHILAQAGEKRQAVTIANLALEEAKAIRDKRDKATVEGKVAQVLALVEEKERALDIANHVLMGADELENERDKADVLKEIVQVLIQTEQLDQALVVARTIWSEGVQANVLQEMVRAFIQAKQFNQALAAAGAIWNESVQMKMHQELVQVLIQAGQFDQALMAAKAIEDEDVRVASYRELVQALIQAGQFDQALMAAKAIEDEDVRVASYRELVQALIQAGQFDQALIAAKAIEGEDVRVASYRELVQALIQAGQFDQALMATETIRNSSARASILNEVIQGMIGIGEKERAVITAHQVLDLTGTFINGWSKTSMLRKIARALAQVTLVDRAMEVVEAIDDELDKVNTVSEIALALAQIGQCGQAVEVVEMIGNQWVKVTTLKEITHTLIRIREHDRAVDVANQALAIAGMIEDEGILSDVLSSLAQALTQAGQFDQALLVVETIKGQWSKAKAFREVIQILIQDGEEKRAVAVTKQAMTVIQGIRGELNNAMAFQEVVQALALIEQFDQALEVAKMIRDRESKGAALQVVALALARTGQCNQALEVAEMIKDKGSKVVVLREVVQVLTQIGEKEQAAALANQALEVAETIKDKRSKVAALRETALALALVDEKENTITVVSQALAAAETIKNQWGKETEFRALAHILIQEGQCDRALVMAEAMSDEGNKLDMLSCIAQGLINIGQFDQALAVVAKIENKWKKETVLSKIARQLTQRGEHEKARRVLQTAFAIARQVGRESVYEVLEFGAVTLSLIDQGQTLWSIYEAILEIDSWWRAR